ncbi:MAG: ATP-binding protein [Proteobacteria bacterium]|nr:ATP-binding protein [Pseudomonadota bacterium]
MERLFYQTLLDWKSDQRKKPLLVMGARQVGKTYLVTQFGEQEYSQIHTFNFQENSNLNNLFKKDLNIVRILEELSITQKRDIDLERDLIFFDEIQECDEAITSLKYFQEKLPNINLISAGSLLGVKLNPSSFPVGKVDIQYLYPMSFEEFLVAHCDPMLTKLFSETNRLESAHRLLWILTCQYYFVGGMPAAINEWLGTENINQRISAVRKTQDDIITGYEKDFAKHSGKINALDLMTLFRAVASQISRVIDGSVKRFKFKDVLANKKTFKQLSNTISWLENAGLVYKVHLIESQPRIPLKSYIKENFFKLFLFDVGILGAMLELPYDNLLNQDYGISKGYFAENFVVCEFKSTLNKSLYSWVTSKAEIEFLYVGKNSDIYPLEVKSGQRTKAKSLQSYIDRYQPGKTIKLVGKVGGSDIKNLVLPLYYSSKLKELL